MADYRGVFVAALAGILAAPAGVSALDVPVSARKVVLKQSATREKLVFVVRDPNLVAPVPGSADDPTSGGLRVLLVRGDDPGTLFATLQVPAGFGSPGWSANAYARGRYRYRNGGAPGGPSLVRSARLDAKGLKIVARDAGMPLDAPMGSLTVVVEIGGTLRACALIDGDSVVQDAVGVFVGKNASSPTATTCDPAHLLHVPCDQRTTCGGGCAGAGACVEADPIFGGCICVDPATPCGGTAPVCNGTCPAGEACASITGYPTACACLPAGSAGCGTLEPGMCSEGGCPAGFECQTDVVTIGATVTFDVCNCVDPNVVPTCDGAPCPAPWQCIISPALTGCLPPNCGVGDTCGSGEVCILGFCFETCGDTDPFPTCGGGCGPNFSCAADPIGGTSTCLCAP